MIRHYNIQDKEYIVNSHYKLYNKEFNYDLSFKEFIEKNVDGFIERQNSRETILILEFNHKQNGSVSIKKLDDITSQIGLFLVEPNLRGEGYGKQLIEKAIEFSRENGYKKIILWTNYELKAARKIYESFGFNLVEKRKQVLSGKELLEEKWILNII